MGKLKGKKYEELLEPLQIGLISMAQWAKVTGARVLVLFEGRDAAGKSGVINAITAPLNPRQCRTVALAKPSEREAGQWYFQRYIEHLPSAGEIVLFDRSWYNRAGVEKVMGYASDEQVDTFLAQVPVFEKQLVDDGLLLFKYWLTTDQAEQEQRLAERYDDPLKRWKLSPVDMAARERYIAYTVAREAMLKASHKEYAPWTLVDFNDQKRGRLTVINNLLARLPDVSVPAPDFAFDPLDYEPAEEYYSVVKPIPSFDIED
ncbi:polyphosphate kinase [Erythrobacter sp. SG61-1L]|uniref:polyphosphate kinase 2 n=1 Tax=Erythrobacter sp. SG61-1L TaxID=1603897 RepID=UPI0006C9337A|nr:polyphosphate kinase 2 [Erythrobacter sp. SG61-1L]KPL69248.1 polyphosphate kinase [Erythrobacter sp. SG61-1L]